MTKKWSRGVFAKWRRRTRRERFLLLEAFLLLVIARMALRVLPFKRLAASLGRHMREADGPVEAPDLSLAEQVGRAVRAAARYTPRESVCLPQAVAAQWMLRRRRIPGTLYLGLAKCETDPERLAAHAWLRCGEHILTGDTADRKFTVISTFS